MPFGSTMEFSNLQWPNVSLPIDTRLSGSSTVFNWMQSNIAPFCNVVTPYGIFNAVNERHDLNASSPISETPDGISVMVIE